MRALQTLLALGVGCVAEDDDGYKLPAIVASSEYIDLRPATEVSGVCMGDKLAELDHFVEDTAASLGVAAPSGRIGLVLDPRDLRDPNTWPCSNLIGDCFVMAPHDAGGVIFAEASSAEWGEFAGSQWHELVHAVDLSANGGSHWILKEGLAKYLGNNGSTAHLLDNFPELLLQSVTKAQPDPIGIDYGIALHFVGSLIEAYGVELFWEFRRAVAAGAGVDDFEVAYQNAYGEGLADGLEAMRGTAIYGQKVDNTCDGEPVALSLVGESLRAELGAVCGDGWFYGGLGFDLISGAPDGAARYAKFFVVDVPETELYTMRVHGPDEALYSLLRSCGETPEGSLVAVDGGGSTAVLYSGKHEVLVGFSDGAPTGFTLELIPQGAPPAPLD